MEALKAAKKYIDDGEKIIYWIYSWQEINT